MQFYSTQFNDYCPHTVLPAFLPRRAGRMTACGIDRRRYGTPRYDLASRRRSIRIVSCGALLWDNSTGRRDDGHRGNPRWHWHAPHPTSPRMCSSSTTLNCHHHRTSLPHILQTNRTSEKTSSRRFCFSDGRAARSVCVNSCAKFAQYSTAQSFRASWTTTCGRGNDFSTSFGIY